MNNRILKEMDTWLKKNSRTEKHIPKMKNSQNGINNNFADERKDEWIWGKKRKLFNKKTEKIKVEEN